MQLLAKWAPHVARVVFGLLFLLASLVFFLHLAPQTPPPQERAQTFMAGLAASGYVMQVVKTVELTCSLALLANRFVPLALTLLAPIVVNIAAVHLLLVPNYGMAFTVVALEAYLAWTHRATFAPLFRARTTR